MSLQFDNYLKSDQKTKKSKHTTHDIWIQKKSLKLSKMYNLSECIWRNCFALFQLNVSLFVAEISCMLSWRAKKHWGFRTNISIVIILSFILFWISWKYHDEIYFMHYPSFCLKLRKYVGNISPRKLFSRVWRSILSAWTLHQLK